MRKLRKEFNGIVAVDDVDLELYQNEITSIIGPNGAGKTTLTNLISGVLAPTSGRIVFEGDDITDMKQHRRIKRRMVRSFQIPQMYPEFSTLDNVRVCVLTREDENRQLYRALAREDDATQEALEILDRFELSPLGDTEAKNLAHGERKVLDTAMSFALDPKLIILDEPTSGVGSKEKDDVMQTVVEVARTSEIAMVFIEHDLELVEEYADRTIAMHQGGILNDGSPDDVLGSTEVKEHIREEGM